jgi:hypothetical protein
VDDEAVVVFLPLGDLHSLVGSHGLGCEQGHGQDDAGRSVHASSSSGTAMNASPALTLIGS